MASFSTIHSHHGGALHGLVLQRRVVGRVGHLAVVVLQGGDVVGLIGGGRVGAISILAKLGKDSLEREERGREQSDLTHSHE